MKRFKQLFLSLLAVVLLSGCTMKAEFNMVIKEDKSMDFSIVMAMDEELLQVMLSQDLEDDGEVTVDVDNIETADGVTVEVGDSATDTTEKETADVTEADEWAYLDSAFGSDEDADFEAQGFKKEKYEVDTFKGYKYTKTFASIDEVTDTTGNYTTGEIAGEDAKLFTKEGDTYKASIDLGLDDDMETEYEGMDLSSIYDMKFVVTLPSKPISHNATSVSEDGKTLTWDLTKLNGKTIDFSFEFPKSDSGILGGNNVLYICLGVCAVLVIVVVIVVVSKKKRNKQQPAMPEQQVTMNVQPTYPQQPSVQPIAPSVQPTAPTVQPMAPATQPMESVPVAPVEPQAPVSQPVPAAPVVAPVEAPTMPQPEAPVVPAAPVVPEQPVVPENTENNQ